jgi:phosphoglycolate phosphatase
LFGHFYPVKYRLAIFDFDGTLADTFPFFLRVFNQLAEKHKFQTIAPELVPTFRGYSARRMLDEIGLPAWKLPFVARSFTALMREQTGSISLFPEVEELLLHLTERGVTLAMVSSNDEDNVRRILGAANAKLFCQFECGMSLFGKTSRIQKVLRKTGIPRHEAIYIGDQVTDLEAARKVKVAFGAVSWGYATMEALRAHVPEEEFESVMGIRRIF